MSDDGAAHGFFDPVLGPQVLVIADLFAGLWLVAFLVAQSTGNLLTRGILAGELAFFLDGWCDRFKVAEGALVQTFDVGILELLLLLYTHELVVQGFAQDLLQFRREKIIEAVFLGHALHLALHYPDLRLDVLRYACHAERMGLVASACKHLLYWRVSKADLAFYLSTGSTGCTTVIGSTD